MLRLEIPEIEEWDEEKQEFVYTKGGVLQLEHSLVSISKWEAKWGRAFLSRTPKSHEETIDYIRCMTLTQNVDQNLYTCLTGEHIAAIGAYIEAPMTATHFSEKPHGGGNGETVTSELIYYWMITLGIPFECQKWHLNRLLTLIRVCSIKNRPPKKMSRNEILRRNSALNTARRRQHGTKG